MTLEIVAFTAKGARLAGRLCGMFGQSAAYAPLIYCAGKVIPLEEPTGQWVKKRFKQGNTLVFVGAVGIAVRLIAPYIKSKDVDPAVICIDEDCTFVIPVLSGHIGGANSAAKEIAERTGARLVLTTATDRNNVFAFDDWGAKNNCKIPDISQIKHISSALLNGEEIGFISDFDVIGDLPDNVIQGGGQRCGVLISQKISTPFEHTLQLIPRCVIAGIGCRKGISTAILRRKLIEALDAAGLTVFSVGTVATIKLKENERGLIGLCEDLAADFKVFAAHELLELPGEFTSSDKVKNVTGVDNVCERSAVCAGGRLILKKTSGDGVTVALAITDYTVKF